MRRSESHHYGSDGGLYSTGSDSNGQTPSLASIYQARKLGEKKTVEALARQFQDQIERIMMEKGRGVEKSYIPSRNEREVNEFKKLNREKSFDEARTAVQSQIEKIFQKSAGEVEGQVAGVVPGSRRQYKMHGISHVVPGEDRQGPAPVHHGVRHLISQHPLAYQSRHASMETIGQDSPTPMTSSRQSSASSMIDLSQSQIRLSPLQRATSHISLNITASSSGESVQKSVQRSDQRSDQRTTQRPAQRSASSGLWRHQSQSQGQTGSRSRMTRSQSHLTGRDSEGSSLHLDRFLASVERTNAETEYRLSDEYQSQAELTTSTPIPGQGQVNLRRGRTISARWRSMESLTDRESTRSGSRSRPSVSTRDSSQERHRQVQHNRQSLGPQGFTSLVNLVEGERPSQPPPGPPLPVRNRVKSPVGRTESLPLDSMSMKSSCSCTTDQTHNTVQDSRKAEPDSKKTKIEYLGSVPIDSKATDLNNLQIPMKNLYFKLVEMRNMGHQQLPGTIEISDTGLKVNYIRELHKGVQEIFNPFTTIAVWAAVKLVVKKEQATSGEIRHKFAFLPLIADPDDGGKTELFYPLSSDESILASCPSHPAMFAAVMRKAGVPKQLECHGFICDSPEEAIMLAANLYQALLETMKRNKRSSSAAQGSTAGKSPSLTGQDSDVPNRPPRKKKRDGGGSSVGSSVARRRSVRRARSVKRTDTVRSRTRPNLTVRTGGSVRRRTSLRKNGSVRRSTMKAKTISGEPPGKAKGLGDIYTKVAIPRSKSFMNVSGQYNLQELFKELREKEGIESVDDILREVISSGGMSFNKIKPVYREMLMKLVMTMSKDEIFIRSQNIMNEQKKKNKGKPWTSFGSKAAKESKLLKNPPKQIKGIQQPKKKINKSDIGAPVPINIPKKFAVRVEDLLEGVDLPSKVAEKVPGKEVGRGKSPEESEDPYVSCSECGYQSLCGTYCSCSLYSKTLHSTDSSGCSSCECSECREQGDVCYSCSLYNESSNAGTVRSHKPPLAPASPLTAWRNNMRMTGGPGTSQEERRELMSSSALPSKPKSSTSRTASSARSVMAARRQFRESQAVDSSSDCSSLPRPPRQAKSRSVSREHSLAPSSARSKPSQTRTVSNVSGANQRNYPEIPSAAADQEGVFRNLSRSPSQARQQRTVLPSVSGHSKSRQSHNLHSEGSVSIDSLSLSSGNSQKIAFSETNMQSSLGYLP